MTERILCVDDDASILQAYQRALRKQFYIEIALGGEEALTAVKQHGPYAVVVADMRMPGMSGVELLAQVRQVAPETVRMMLTGNADQQTAIDAVNHGHIFRFLTKPCPPESFAAALRAGLEQYRLITAERELTTKTLAGSVKVLTDILGLVSPAAFGRAARVRRLVQELCRQLDVQKSWPIEIAAMLCQIGCIGVPEETLQKCYRGEELSAAEAEQMFESSRVGSTLIAQIPRLEEVAEIIAHQNDRYDGRCEGLRPGHLRCQQAAPGSVLRGTELPLGSRILKVALDYDALLAAGSSQELAMAHIHDRSGWYDPQVVAALRRVLDIAEVQVIRKVRVQDLVDGAILADDVRSLRGTLLCARGQEVTPLMRSRLKSYLASVGVQSPISILVPMDKVASMADQLYWQDEQAP